MKVNNLVLTKAAVTLKKGGVVISPTDTVYGFLADAGNKKAVEKIYKIKKRPKSKTLPIFVKDMAMAKKLAFVDKKAEKFLKTPKVTVVLKIRPGVKLNRVVLKDTVAMRIPQNTFLQNLLKKVNRPLAQTSVNISNQKPLYKAEDIQKVFGKHKLVGFMIDGGDVKKAKPSKIIDLSGEKVATLRK